METRVSLKYFVNGCRPYMTLQLLHDRGPYHMETSDNKFLSMPITLQKMTYINNLFSKCEQICIYLQF